MTLQYFEALKDMAESPSTKFIFPLEFTGMMQNFVANRKEQASE